MSFARTLAARLLSALLIVATLAAGHQHRLVAPASDALVIDRAQGVVTAAAEVAHCAVCRALQTAEPVTRSESGVAVSADVDVVADDATPLPSRSSARPSPRAPPAHHA